MRVRINYLFTYLIIGGCFLYSCQSDYVVNESNSVPNPWNKNYTVDFEFKISDTLSSYSFYINVRNNEEYPYSNIYFFINTILPNGKSARDTIECILANARGKWIGKGMGSLKESNHFIRNKLYFPNSGTYRMEIEQAMRIDELIGIKDIGVKIKKEVN